jgi:hypothetical protein
MNYYIYNFTHKKKPKCKVMTDRRTLYVGEGIFPEHQIERTIEVLKRLKIKTTSDFQAMRKEKI